ncbi:MAG: SpoVR family protein [Chloroflexi bacterium]|nr:SpoVR family protein [Chloroflexota bacterium]
MDDKEIAELEKAIEQIWDIAKGFGLDPFSLRYEIVPATIMYEFGAYGLPGRFSHWTHGKAYHQIKTMYDYGLSKIYELVINSDPCYAFLMEANSLIQNKMVAAHVMAHADFFRRNVYFQHTSRQMVEGASLNANRIRRYEFEHGSLEVEQFLDAVLSIQEHVNPHRTFRRKTDQEYEQDRKEAKAAETPYDDLLLIGERKPDHKPRPRKIPEEPEKDILLFIAEHSSTLEPWQLDIIYIIRNETLYFYPQMQTKIMNEGWASYWHSRIMREMELSEEEYIEFAGLHSAVLATSPRRLNPYLLGMRVFEDIERRWDEPSSEDKERLGRKGGEGRAKIFEVREMDNDASFLRNYLTKELVEELDMYLYELEGDQWVVKEKDWEKVREALVNSMINQGFPYIVVEDGDFRHSRELYLKHYFDGRPLDVDYAEKTLQHVYKLWGRTVHLETVVDDRPTVLIYDGTEIKRARLEAA